MQAIVYAPAKPATAFRCMVCGGGWTVEGWKPAEQMYCPHCGQHLPTLNSGDNHD